MSAHENEASREPVTPADHAAVPPKHDAPAPPGHDDSLLSDASSLIPDHDAAMTPTHDAPVSPRRGSATTQAHDNGTTAAHDAVVGLATDDDNATMSGLSRRGIRIRIAATMICAGLVLAGTVTGNDDDFPVGPFRMYSTRDDPNGEVRELRVQVLTNNGQVLDVTNTAGAPRRAELEGRLGDLVARPPELAKLAPLYTGRLRDVARTLRLVWLVHPLHHGRSEKPSISVICSTSVSSS